MAKQDDFDSAPVGWFAWYKVEGLFTRIPVAGWVTSNDIVIPWVLSKKGVLVPYLTVPPGYTFVGIQFPGMSEREKKLLLDGGPDAVLGVTEIS